jgi:dihydrofolate synthase/folylpolyglutamate synthase
MEEKPTEFELITAIAFEYFRSEKCDVVVLEVGLGGRLDSTNVIESPLLSIITGIDFDHTALLGNTIQAIAAEKAGIIKEGCPCLYGGQSSSAGRTIRQIAELRHAPYHTVDRSECQIKKMTLEGTIFDFEELKDLQLSLLGSYQQINVSIVLNALNILSSNGISVSEGSIRKGLSSVRWPARFELCRQDPTVICDGGHNPQGVAAAVASIRQYFPEQKVNILTGVMEDKNYDEMIEELKSVAHTVFTVRPENPRALDAERFAENFRRHKIPATAFESMEAGVAAALEASRKENRPLICLGSLYLYNSIIDLF